jgi:hypothetical protein
MLHLPTLRSILLPGVVPLPAASLKPTALLLPIAGLFLSALRDRIASVRLLLRRIGLLRMLLGALWLRDGPSDLAIRTLLLFDTLLGLRGPALLLMPVGWRWLLLSWAILRLWLLCSLSLM